MPHVFPEPTLTLTGPPEELGKGAGTRLGGGRGKEGTNKTRNIRKEGPRRGLPYCRLLFPGTAGKPVQLIFHVVCTLKSACSCPTAVSSGL